LIDMASKNPLRLEEPAPLFIFTGFGNSSIDIQFSVWAQRENFLQLKNSLYEDIKNTFDREGIEIPFPPTCMKHFGSSIFWDNWT
jgi:small-conductance mechanosensitive channel